MNWFNKIKELFANTGLVAFTWGIICVIAFIMGKPLISAFSLGVFACRNWDWIKSKYQDLVTKTEEK